MAKAEPESVLALHPGLAGTLRLRDGDFARVRSRYGEVVLKVRTSSNLRLDTVFIPFHFGGEQRANLLTSALIDPASKIPEFKLTAVAIDPLLVDAGALPRKRPPRQMDS